jgi:4-amino-4-deoxy-L-arabinose transferase-like glycosyltransferase
MNERHPRPFAPPPLTRGWPLLALLGLFIGFGVLGHDPWKSEDAIHFGTAWRAALASEWLIFQAAPGGSPEAPLYFWLARASDVLFASTLGMPDAFRLTSIVFTTASCALLYLGARELYGAEAAPAAPLALAGCLGFLVQSHETQPVLATLTAICALLAGLAALRSGRGYATPLLAAGLAALLLADGLALLPAMLLSLAAVPLFAGTGERRALAVRAAVAVAAAAVLASPWWIGLHRNGDGLLAAVLAEESARLSGVADFPRNALGYLGQLTWFSWPAWPLAIWGIWVRRHAWRSDAVWLGAVVFVLLWANLGWVTPLRSPPAMLLLPPLALLAAQGVPQLRRGAAQAFDWFGRLTFALLALLLWFGWFAMHFRLPPKVAHNILRLSPGFEPQVSWPATAFAAAITLLWLWFIVREPRTPLRGLAHWTAGMTLAWCLTMTLWLPWIEHQKSYRPVGAAISRIVAPESCIETRALGTAQHAAIEYALGRRYHAGTGSECRYLLVQGGRDEHPPEAEWRKVWEGSRPGDRNERLRLYHRG